MFDYWYWSLRTKGTPQVIQIDHIVRTRYHDCELPQIPRWVKSDERFFFGLFRKRKLENPHDLEDLDIWTCKECSAEWILFGCYKGGDDL